MGVAWTAEQRQVIDLRGRNILVSAAAGSGKTAVLVERIIARLTKDERPIDVDELLIVTFTEAAAAEMKERVLLAIEKKLEEEPDNAHLQKQAALIHSALITTIHSFCLTVIREHFHTIDLDPGFRIGEEGELKLLRKDVLDELLEEEYEKADERFIGFVERYAAGRDDRKLEDILLQIYEFSRSYPDPDGWLESCVEAYAVTDVRQLEESAAAVKVLENIRRYAADAAGLLEDAIRACDEPDGPYMYRETLEAERDGFRLLCEAGSLTEVWNRKGAVDGGRLKANRDKNVSPELSDYVKDVRKEAKALFADIEKNYLFQSPEEMLEDMKSGRETVEELVFLVRTFAEKFEKKKRSKNIIDFGDMEHLALRILTRQEDGKFVPSDVAKEYQNRFQEVMIDEYQDSNLIQEAILTSVSTVSQGSYNIFMVGDVKQSIYRFRLSRPELFMEKFDTYTLSDGVCQRIDLHKNFRSRKEVLDSTNFVFEQIMTKSLGGITYDEKAALYAGADYAERAGDRTEVLAVSLDDEEGTKDQVQETARELEARAAARKIKQLIREYKVTDKATGEARPAEYRDIVILTRSLKGWTDVFAKILNREGIPTYTGSREGYFETQEIQTILDYLRVLDNPNQDIPLAAVLTSRMAGLSGEELAAVRVLDAEAPFYLCVKRYAREGGDAGLRRKLAGILDQMAYFREMIPYTAIHELLWKIIGETGYRYETAAMPGGEQRSANVDMLLEKAKAFETTSYRGLFNFVRYIEQLKKYDVDYGEAGIADEQTNAVRLMSIHKSKGLEFPVVIVAGMNKRFNKQDAVRDIVVHPELGIGVDVIDLEKRTKAPSFLKKAVQREVLLENAGEELRVLYVAMTRAKEKLILLGTLSDIDRKRERYGKLQERKERQFSFSMLSGANTYFDWVLPCFLRNPASKEADQVQIVGLADLVSGEILEETAGAYTKERLKDWDTERVFSEEYAKEIDRQFSYRYPYEGQQDIRLKFTVSELKKHQGLAEESGEVLFEEEEAAPVLPKKLREEEKSGGASRGTAYHRVLELLDFTKVRMIPEREAETQLDRQLRQFVCEGKLAEEMYDRIYMKDILHFLDTETAKRMSRAAERSALYTEQPFVLGVDVTEIYPEEEPGEMLLIQGIIDVWFEEEDGIVVLDYKTDRVKKESELRERYAGQLDYYAKALERLTGKKVLEKIIYSFALQKEISVQGAQKTEAFTE